MCSSDHSPLAGPVAAVEPVRLDQVEPTDAPSQLTQSDATLSPAHKKNDDNQYNIKTSIASESSETAPQKLKIKGLGNKDW